LAAYAEKMFADGAREVLQADPRFRVVDQPTLSAAENAIVREHFKLFLLVTRSIQDAILGGKAWVATKRAADYRLGDGLGFLADRTGARYGFVFVTSHGVGLHALPTNVVCALVDLSTGRIVWYNSSQGLKRFQDLQSPNAARDVVGDVFRAYPQSPGISFADRSVPEPRP
jgi:hypothetical protein